MHHVFLLFKLPQAPHLFFMIPWTPNACRDVSKCQISITTLMTHDFYNAPNVFPQFIAPKASHPLLFLLPWTPNACSDVGKCQISITMTFIMHLIYVFPQFNSPNASHLLFFKLPWTPNACCDVS